MSNILPLIPMTHRQLSLLPPDEQRAYWVRVFNAWSPSREHLDQMQRDFQADHRAARAGNEWSRS